MTTVYQKILRNLFINPTVSITFTVMVLVFFLIEVGAWKATEVIKVSVDDVVRGHNHSAHQAHGLRINLYRMRFYEKDLFLHIDSPKDVEKYKGMWDDAYKEFDLIAGHLMMMSDSDSGIQGNHKRAGDIQDLQVYVFGFEKVVKEIREGRVTDPSEANKIMKPYKANAYSVDDMAKAYSIEVDTACDHARVGTFKLINKIQALIVAVAGAVFLLVVILTSVIIHAVLKNECGARYGRRREDLQFHGETDVKTEM